MAGWLAGSCNVYGKGLQAACCLLLAAASLLACCLLALLLPSTLALIHPTPAERACAKK